MNVSKKYLVAILFAFAGVLLLVPTVKDLVKGEPVRNVFLVLALSNFTLAVVFLAVGRKSGGGAGLPSA
ncbi:MAG: hypothetical protein ACJ8F7_21765 [Gemmataceae bacterium]